VKLSFHRAVQADVRRALEYFDHNGGARLGDRFFAELEALQARIAANPKQFGFSAMRFAPPGSVLFRIVRGEVRVLVLRHNRRHPEFGLSRR
jgi:hypothetical protein